MQTPDLLPKLIPIAERHFKDAMKDLKLYRDSLWMNLKETEKMYADLTEMGEDDKKLAAESLSIMQDEIDLMDHIIGKFQSAIATAMADEDTTLQ